MPTLHSLKKQLKGVRSTLKITKAMKTVSTVKFSKLNGIYNRYSHYANECRHMFEHYGEEILESVCVADPDAPTAVIVMASNKGFCGGFNSELLNFALGELKNHKKTLVFTCGKKAADFFKNKKIAVEKEYYISDVPSYAEANALLDQIMDMRRSGRVSGVFVIYPEYINMLIHRPCVCVLFSDGGSVHDDTVTLVPDRETIAVGCAKAVLGALFYETVLETALGAQAATLSTMRSAYDTAVEYCERLEGQINRKRQSAVTADVIITAE